MNESDEKKYNSVILGALLHDVGKMIQRGSFGSLDTKGKHPQVSAVFVSAFKEFFSKFVDFELLKTLVQRHHEDSRLGDELICQNAPAEYRGLSYLVSRADNYSSAERGDKSETYQDFKATPLVSIFSRIYLNKELPEQLKYRLNSLLPENVFPEKFNMYSDGEFNGHLENFGRDFTEFVRNSKSNDFNTMFTNLMTILMKYAWCIPSNTQEEIPDVSLFDHLKTTCAIAACLYQYHHSNFVEKKIKDDKTEKFIVLVGDLSGIQNYIYDITHIGAGGIAKRLRARSFQLSMISEIISHKILHVFNLPIANILMVSGGKFYVLLPKISDTKDRINKIRKDIDLWFYENLNAEVNANIAAIPLSGNDFKEYGIKMQEINRLLQKVKKKPFDSIISYEKAWIEDKVVLNVDFGEEEKLCKACRKFHGQEREDKKFICDKCNDDKEVGQKLPNARHIAFYKNDEGMFKGYFGYSFDLLNEHQKARKGAYLLLNITDLSINHEFPTAYHPIANWIPTFVSDDDCKGCKNNSNCTEKNNIRTGQPKFFECISYESEGKKMLGYLKADVDNLGAIFAFGLKDSGTVSRIATLSRMLDVFFSGYMQKLIENNYPEIYTVYSGGDDILVIGQWDSIIKFADELNSEFRRFTSNNKNITLSAGISFVKHNYPVFRAVEMADKFLDLSKNSGKDRLTVFGHISEWKELNNIIDESEKLKNWLRDKKMSSGFVMNLLAYSQMQKKGYIRFLPLMIYDIARNLPSLTDKDIEKREIRLWAEELKDLNGNRMQNLGIIANYALNANRGDKDE